MNTRRLNVSAKGCGRRKAEIVREISNIEEGPSLHRNTGKGAPEAKLHQLSL